MLYQAILEVKESHNWWLNNTYRKEDYLPYYALPLNTMGFCLLITSLPKILPLSALLNWDEGREGKAKNKYGCWISS